MWKSMVTEPKIDDIASRALLRTALEAHQRARLCRETIDEDGQTFHDRFGQIRAHPLLATERDARTSFVSGLKALNLDLEST